MCQVEYEDFGTGATNEDNMMMELLCDPSEFASCKKEEGTYRIREFALCLNVCFFFIE